MSDRWSGVLKHDFDRVAIIDAAYFHWRVLSRNLSQSFHVLNRRLDGYMIEAGALEGFIKYTISFLALFTRKEGVVSLNMAVSAIRNRIPASVGSKCDLIFSGVVLRKSATDRCGKRTPLKRSARISPAGPSWGLKKAFS